MNSLLSKYSLVRKHTEDLCKPLQTEDYVVQPVPDVSPPKWHLGHSTWFFETFFLKPHLPGYHEFNPLYNFVFNSYYETVGNRVIRTDRGNLSRPTVEDIYTYRNHVDEAMEKFLSGDLSQELLELMELGLNHEQQHQELLSTDIKYILGNNPLFPPYTDIKLAKEYSTVDESFIEMESNVYEVGYNGNGFCFDNELSRHQVFLQRYRIANRLVNNEEYLEFINSGGYQNFIFWHAEGWDWFQTRQVKCPMYWFLIDNEWFQYTLNGLKPLDLAEAVCHISYYEAFAYASWKGKRLPTEFEWEVAAQKFQWGKRWEWTESAYLPYPGFKKADGAIGEYNGKFMVNQKVLRGASEVTPSGHSRISYRNFFHPPLRWQYTGIRLAE
ncbi:MAG: ergothioneine biosynthesis protein EgtB [Chitinophagaceae bacterium]